jgi:hypothetical protein
MRTARADAAALAKSTARSGCWGAKSPCRGRRTAACCWAAHDAPAAVRAYFARAFGDRLGEVRAAMEALAAPLPPEELNSVGLRLHERFRPEVPQGVEGWGARAMLDIGRIVRAAE